MGFVAVVGAGMLLGVALGSIQPLLSRQRGRKRAASLGALWTGSANINSRLLPDEAQVVRAAMADWHPSRSRLAIATGVLAIRQDAVEWSPGRMKQGRGRPHGWTISRTAIRSARFERGDGLLPWFNSVAILVLDTEEVIKLVVLDSGGMRAALGISPASDV